MKANKHKAALDLFLAALHDRIMALKKEQTEFSLLSVMTFTEEKMPLFYKGNVEIWLMTKSTSDIVVRVQKIGRIENMDALEAFKDEVLQETFSKCIDYFDNYETIQV